MLFKTDDRAKFCALLAFVLAVAARAWGQSGQLGEPESSGAVVQRSWHSPLREARLTVSYDIDDADANALFSVTRFGRMLWESRHPWVALRADVSDDGSVAVVVSPATGDRARLPLVGLFANDGRLEFCRSLPGGSPQLEGLIYMPREGVVFVRVRNPTGSEKWLRLDWKNPDLCLTITRDASPRCEHATCLFAQRIPATPLIVSQWGCADDDLGNRRYSVVVEDSALNEVWRRDFEAGFLDKLDHYESVVRVDGAAAFTLRIGKPELNADEYYKVVRAEEEWSVLATDSQTRSVERPLGRRRRISPDTLKELPSRYLVRPAGLDISRVDWAGPPVHFSHDDRILVFDTERKVLCEFDSAGSFVRDYHFHGDDLQAVKASGLDLALDWIITDQAGRVWASLSRGRRAMHGVQWEADGTRIGSFSWDDSGTLDDWCFVGGGNRWRLGLKKASLVGRDLVPVATIEAHDAPPWFGEFDSIAVDSTGVVALRETILNDDVGVLAQLVRWFDPDGSTLRTTDVEPFGARRGTIALGRRYYAVPSSRGAAVVSRTSNSVAYAESRDSLSDMTFSSDGTEFWAFAFGSAILRRWQVSAGGD